MSHTNLPHRNNIAVIDDPKFTELDGYGSYCRSMLLKRVPLEIISAFLKQKDAGIGIRLNQHRGRMQ